MSWPWVGVSAHPVTELLASLIPADASDVVEVNAGAPTSDQAWSDARRPRRLRLSDGLDTVGGPLVDDGAQELARPGRTDTAVMWFALQQLDPRGASELLDRVAVALRPQGTVIVAGCMPDHGIVDRRALELDRRRLRARCPEGGWWSLRQQAGWLARAGFEGLSVVDAPGNATIVGAQSPGS